MGTKKPLLERFEDKIFYSPDGCWIWTANIAPEGYGRLTDNVGSSRKSLRVHRLSYEMFKGKIPDGLWVLHKCDVRSCVNPDHLFLGTPLDNAKDAVSKNRLHTGQNHHSSKLNDELVLILRSSNKSDAELARIYGLARSTVREARLGITWRHVNSAVIFDKEEKRRKKPKTF